MAALATAFPAVPRALVGMPLRGPSRPEKDRFLSASLPSPWPSLSRGHRGSIFLLVLALHGGGLAYALHSGSAVVSAMVPQPMSVRLIDAVPAARPQPEVAPPQPMPPKVERPRQPKAPAPVPLAKTPAPILAATPAAAVSSDFVAPESPPSRPASSTIAAAPALVPARFDADYLHNPKPVYPPMSRRFGEEGKVLLKVRVTPQGTAEQVDIQTGSGYSRLDSAAREAVQRWRFVPARRGDEAVAASVIVPITFALDS